MPWFRLRGRGALTPFVAVLLVLTAAAEEREPEPPSASEPAARRTEDGSTVERPTSPGDVRADEMHIPSTTACVDAGYLCDEVEKHGSFRVVRFPLDTEAIRVRVPLPEDEDPERARQLRRAAIRGISAWHDRPFPIRFLEEDANEEPDLVLRWEVQLSDGGLGETRSRFSREEERSPDYRVVDLTLATRNPYDADRPLPPEHVELTAAHEMGHALGLPHSASRGDLMYPTDAAKGLSERDFRTVEALYSLPNGARIVP